MLTSTSTFSAAMKDPARLLGFEFGFDDGFEDGFELGFDFGSMLRRATLEATFLFDFITFIDCF